MSEKKADPKAKADENQVNVHANAADYLDPSINVSENPQGLAAQEKENRDGQLTGADLVKEREEKNKRYEKEREERDGVSRSPVDKGQEAHLSPEAKRALEESQKK